MRWLRRTQAGKLVVRSRQLTAQRFYYRGQLVVNLGEQFALECGVALFKKFTGVLRLQLPATRLTRGIVRRTTRWRKARRRRPPRQDHA